ncbi:MAG: M28 family peptidase, partial [Vicinamibacteria bacterium]|nr:M28 family peptidase [Vicinamibacteria bacterium]
GGRAPGSPGEEITVNYLVEQFKAAGAEPGNPDGTWVQKVPLVSLTATNISPLVVKKGGRTQTFKPHDQVVAFSQHVADAISVKDSEIVFVGYGVQAPEYQWDDLKGMDVKGKTLVVLVNDPPVPDPADPKGLDPKTFGGKAMTYYGRWTYKYEKAAELGAAAVLIVHETAPAGYPFNVVQGFGGERFDLVTPDKNLGRAAIQGWISLEAATALLKTAGQDYQALKAQARTREFTPVALGMTASMSFTQKMRSVDSRNVVAKITGSDPTLKSEYVVYTGHWDHFGTGTPVNGDAIYNGARDNATGTAMLLEFARAFKKVRPAAKRTVVFVSVTAEEQGLLGSAYYAKFPLYPLDKTLANINVDAMNVWGRTKDVTIVGLGNSDLDTYARDAAAEQRRVLRPDSEPEKGFYYRSDHFNFAKVGVPALNSDPGVDFIDKPASYGQQKRTEWTEQDYHQPSDEVKDWWDLTGAADDGTLLFAVGYRVANAERYPEWTPGTEFRAARDRMLRR